MSDQGKLLCRVTVVGGSVRIGMTAEKVRVNDRYPVDHMIVREKRNTPVIAQEKSQQEDVNEFIYVFSTHTLLLCSTNVEYF